MVGSLAQGLANHVSILFTGLKNTIAKYLDGNQEYSLVRMERAEKPGVVHCVQSETGGSQRFQGHGFRHRLRAFLPGERGAVRVPVRHQLHHLAAGEGAGMGKDFINGIADGIRSAIGNVVNAVSDVAGQNTLLPALLRAGRGAALTDYESWMPDFMSGLAKGIEKSRGMVKKAVSGVASDLMLQPQAAVQGCRAAGILRGFFRERAARRA